MQIKTQRTQGKIYDLFIQNQTKEWEIVDISCIIDIDRTVVHRHLKKLIET